MVNEYDKLSGYLMPVQDNPTLKLVEPALARVYNGQSPVGSGFVLEDNGLFFVTAAHVLCRKKREERRIIFASGQELEIDLEDATFHPDRDLASFPLEGKVDLLPKVALRRSAFLPEIEDMEGLDEVMELYTIIAGYPYSYLNYHNLDHTPLYSVGRFLQLMHDLRSKRYPGSKPTVFTTDNRVEPGMSGGPVLDQDNAVIAVINRKQGEPFGTFFLGFSPENNKLHSPYNFTDSSLLPDSFLLSRWTPPRSYGYDW